MSLRSCLLKLLGGRFLFLLLCLAIPCRAEQVLLQPNDRVAWVGDSITEYCSHVGIVEQYIYAVHPDWKIHFFISGWAGESAPAAQARLERDVLPEKPTVAFLHYGMNDGEYSAKSNDVVARYADALSKAVQKLKHAGVRVILIGPTCVDPDQRPQLGKVNYNQTLRSLNEVALNVAEQEEIPFLDIYTMLIDYQNRLKSQNPQATILPDGIHPGTEGGMVIASSLLSQLGIKHLPDWGTFDVTTGNGSGIKLEKYEEKSWEFTVRSPSPPAFYVAPEDDALARRSGLIHYAGRKLTVKGLPAGAYRISLDDLPGFDATSQNLSQGILLPDWSSDVAREMRDIIREKDSNYHTLWNEVRIFYSGIPGASKTISGLLEADEGYHLAVLNLAATSRKLTITLTFDPGSH